jgi:hypothetical protein
MHPACVVLFVNIHYMSATMQLCKGVILLIYREGSETQGHIARKWQSHFKPCVWLNHSFSHNATLPPFGISESCHWALVNFYFKFRVFLVKPQEAMI